MEGRNLLPKKRPGSRDVPVASAISRRQNSSSRPQRLELRQYTACCVPQIDQSTSREGRNLPIKTANWLSAPRRQFRRCSPTSTLWRTSSSAFQFARYSASRVSARAGRRFTTSLRGFRRCCSSPRLQSTQFTTRTMKSRSGTWLQTVRSCLRLVSTQALSQPLFPRESSVVGLHHPRGPLREGPASRA